MTSFPVPFLGNSFISYRRKRRVRRGLKTSDIRTIKRVNEIVWPRGYIVQIATVVNQPQWGRCDASGCRGNMHLSLVDHSGKVT